jgi:2,3-bisphosphoglycerate-dependent phosphoglycerate mutase
MHPRFDKLYSHLSEEEHRKMPLSESLEQCKARVQPYWNEQILPTLKNLEGGKTVLFVAHKHVLRSLVQQFAGLDNKSIKKLFIPNACPFIFEFDKNDDHKPVKNYYIDDLNQDVFSRAKTDDAKLE